MKAVVTKSNDLSIPSASGLELLNGKLYVIGDDVPWLYQIDEQGKVLDKHLLLQGVEQNQFRISKSEKADLESITSLIYNGKQYLLILSSGSLLPQRDYVLLFNYSTKEVQYFKCPALFIHLQSYLSDSIQLNIEALASDDDKLYIFHRGNISGENMMFSCSIISFFDSLVKSKSFVFTHQKISLSPLNGVNMGVAGATYYSIDDCMFICATAENTSNAYDDGDIIGSAVGWFNLHSSESIKMLPLCNEGGELLPIKVESLVVKQQQNGEYTILAVTDNDKGISQLLEIKIAK